VKDQGRFLESPGAARRSEAHADSILACDPLLVIEAVRSDRYWFQIRRGMAALR
jgi:hypothetical protein